MNLDFEIDNTRFNARASAIIYNKDKAKVLLFKIIDRDYFIKCYKNLNQLIENLESYSY